METFTTAGLIGKFADLGIDALDDREIDTLDVRPNLKQFTRENIVHAANTGSDLWRRMFMNLISCFEQEGEFGLYAAIGTYQQKHKPADAEFVAAVQAGDEQRLVRAFCKALAISFITLYDKGNFKRLLMVDELPAEAEAELSKMRLFAAPVAPLTAEKIVAIARQIAPTAAQELTPTEQCAKDYKEMGSQYFRAKYISNTNNHLIYEQACAEGKIG